MSATFSEIVDEVRELDGEAKRELADLLRAWLIEERRDEILRNAELADREHALGQTKSGTVDGLMADLYAPS